MPNLVMLTKFYPYGTGEAFIENEIDVLSKFYNEILIIACEAPKTSKIRKVPSNVTVKSVAGVGLGGKLIDALRGQINYIGSNDEFRLESQSCKNIKQKAFLGYFEGKCLRIYREIVKKNMLVDFSREPFDLYSYWLFATSRVATMIQSNYHNSCTFSRAHRYDLYEERNSINYLPYRKLFLESFTWVFPCSVDGEKYLQEKYPAFREKIKASLLGTTDYGTGNQSNDGVFRIVSCSRIAPEKRVERIPDALSLLDNKGLRIEWVHIGGGAGLNELAKKTARKLKNIMFNFKGDMPNTEVMKLYHSTPFNLFVNISSSEGLPVSIMEAISFGMPVIATNVGGTSEIVIPEVTGCLLAENFKDEELACAIETFYRMSKTSQYGKYRTQCREFWRTHFQAINNYEKLCSFIQNYRG